MLALEIMGKGMLGIFTVMFVVMLAVWFLQKISKLGSKREKI